LSKIGQFIMFQPNESKILSFSGVKIEIRNRQQNSVSLESSSKLK
jgi:hypothetical protein